MERAVDGRTMILAHAAMDWDPLRRLAGFGFAWIVQGETISPSGSRWLAGGLAGWRAGVRVELITLRRLNSVRREVVCTSRASVSARRYLMNTTPHYG
jgi:hypothetical protein